MIKTLDFSEISEYMDLISLSDAFEIYPVNKNGNEYIYIPYMLNDSVEAVLILSEVKTELIESLKKEVSLLDLYEEDDEIFLSLYHPKKGEIEISFLKAEIQIETYQYHRICHFWVSGDEALRRIVYIIGTINDKYHFLGEEFSNEDEMKLLPLIEFAPLWYFSPVRESLDSYYENTENGIDTFLSMCEGVASERFIKAVLKMKEEAFNGTLSEKRIREISFLLREEEKLIHKINEKIEESSLHFKKRTFLIEEEQVLQKEIEKLNFEMKENGYEGKYPMYQNDKEVVTYYEEHPFVIRDLEYDDFSLRISGKLVENRDE